MAEMSVVSLNVNGLRDHRKRRLLSDFLKNEKFDVIFLQETPIATVEDCVKWNKESGLKGYIGVLACQIVVVLVYYSVIPTDSNTVLFVVMLLDVSFLWIVHSIVRTCGLLIYMPLLTGL
jgi:hypothetical protein